MTTRRHTYLDRRGVLVGWRAWPKPLCFASEQDIESEVEGAAGGGVHRHDTASPVSHRRPQSIIQCTVN